MRSLFVALLFLCGCKAGSRCTNDKNCAAGLFCIKQNCAAPSCKDNARNGDESDVDCGGSCPGCNAGQICTHGADCDSKSCMVGVCGGTSCSDGIKNGTESDIDCGGACGKCANVRACLLASDCQSALCQSATCVDGACGDKIKNGTESDIDCGGGSCALCADHKACVLASDCADGVCTGGSCAPPTCSDGVKNGSESDVDCGAACASKGCNVGQICGDKTDCASAHCINSKCVVCEAPADCEGATTCLSFGCDSNACTPHPSANGTVVEAAHDGDCGKTVCTGNPDGSTMRVLDSADPPSDTSSTDCQTFACTGVGTSNKLCVQSQVATNPNQCIANACACTNNSVVDNPSTTQTVLTSGSCAQSGGKVCSSSGTATCVECNSNPECTKPFETCGGGGTTHSCGCKTNPNACAGLVCGTVDIGCGQQINCGTCAVDHTCNATKTSCDCNQPACNVANQCGSYDVSNSCTSRTCPKSCKHACCSTICCATALSCNSKGVCGGTDP